MTTKQKATWTLMAIGVSGLLWIAPAPSILERITLEEVPSPSHVGSAIFYTSQGFQGGPSTTLFVRDYVKSGSKPLKLADGGGNVDFPLYAVWAQDGTLLAVGEYGKWDFIYDLSKHHIIRGNSHSRLQNSKFLDDLLNKHGGLVPERERSAQPRPQKWWESFDTDDNSLDSES